MGPSRFTSHPRGRCAADYFSPLKIHRLGRVLNPRRMENNTQKSDKQGTTIILKTYVFNEVAFVIFYGLF
jgi:hypothetical protein